jgi:hypothetical protein
MNDVNDEMTVCPVEVGRGTNMDKQNALLLLASHSCYLTVVHAYYWDGINLFNIIQ